MTHDPLTRREFLRTAGCVAAMGTVGGSLNPGAPGLGMAQSPAGFGRRLPNIVVILADDLGYGDVRANVYSPLRDGVPAGFPVK